MPLGLPGTDRPTGQFPHFERADDAAQIMGMQARRRGRVHLGQALRLIWLAREGKIVLRKERNTVKIALRSEEPAPH